LLELRAHGVVQAAIAEIAGHIMHVSTESLPDCVVDFTARLRDCVTHALLKDTMLERLARDAQHREILGHEILCNEIVDRRQQHATREVAGSAEDDHRAARRFAFRRRRSGVRYVTHHLRGLARARLRARAHVFFTAWPPNSLRSAAITLPANVSPWRERKRISSDN